MSSKAIAIQVFLVGWSVIGIIIGWVQWNMPQEEAAKVNVLWHVPPWFIGVAMYVLLMFALYTGENIQQAYIAAVILTIPQNLWCFMTIVFRRFF